MSPKLSLLIGALLALLIAGGAVVLALAESERIVVELGP